MINNGEPTVDAALWHAYSTSFFHFSDKWEVESFAIITACNPASVLRSKAENCISNQRMKARIDGLHFCSVIVADQACSWSEESFAVETNLNNALNLAREFEQNAIYFVERGELFLVSCLSDQRKESIGSFDLRVKGGF
ncbi:DUF3293 domain-containing protein [Vibrio sp. 05-20-BW147]|uniref:DUF3293 domain-containing protein n=1 Tax=Vibrio sp. 05-20-BW147 TaxID=2575834 RepID=UPI0015937286|nr:DUF3293 domain-containing protein [Vibrio sp. 05-20-BW147]NVC63488.1 DUF3293 domain-containing protein [Vibrio sp. 05-20-BW147]